MSTILGSGICDRLLIQDGVVCLERRNLGCHMDEEPESHGSIKTVKDGDSWYEASWWGGEKVRRKVVSALRCLTVRDMTYGATGAIRWRS